MTILETALARNLVAIEMLAGVAESLRLKYDEESEWRPKIEEWYPLCISKLESRNVEIERDLDNPDTNESTNIKEEKLLHAMFLLQLDKQEVYKMLKNNKPIDAFLDCLTNKEKGKYTELLLQSERIDPTVIIGDSINDYDTITIALRAGNTHAVKALVNDGRVKLKDSHIVTAAKKGFVNIMEILLTKLEPTHLALHEAITHSRSKVVKLLLTDGRVIPTSEDFIRAIECLNEEIVKMLLDDGRVDPSVGLAEAIDAERNNIIKMILQDPRTDPSFENNYPLTTALSLGNYEIVEMLLADPRVNPNLTDLADIIDYVIRCMYDNQYGRESEITDDSSAEFYLITNGCGMPFEKAAAYQRTLTLILPHVPASHAALKFATEHEWLEVVKIFLKDSRYNPNDVLKTAISLNGRDPMEVISLFLKDERTDLVQARKLVGQRSSIGAQGKGPSISVQIINMIDAIESSA